METINACTFLTIFLFFGYSLILFDYASQLLVGCSKNRFIHALFASVNILVLFATNLSGMPIFFYWFLLVLSMALEFKLMSKATWLQTVLGSTIIVLNISVVFVTVVTIFSAVTNTDFTDILHMLSMYSQIFCIAFVLLSIMTVGIQKIVATEYVIRLTTAQTYSKMLLSVTLVLIASISYNTYIVLYVNFPHKIAYIIISTVTVCGVFYFIFMYFINFINMVKYKRGIDNIKSEHKAILREKKFICEKMHKDPLTNCYNRKFIYTLLQTLCEKKIADFAVVFVDINALKYVNDMYGHNIGDTYILKVSEAIQRSIRDDDFCARIGGDEFLVVLQNIDNPNDIDVITTRIKHNVKILNKVEDFDMSVSLGGIVVTEELINNGPDAIMAYADKKMQNAKKEFYTRRKK